MQQNPQRRPDAHPAGKVSVRWRLAGWLRSLPEFRGRDRLGGMILSGAPRPSGTVRCTVGPGLAFDARMDEDGSWVDLFFLQFEEPALVPVLEAFLQPGAAFIDVGANVGIYSAWASRLVGESGRVLAFEPVPATRAYLQQVIGANRLDNVTVVPSARGAAAGSVTLWVRPAASGLTSAIQPDASTPAERVDVPMTTLDQALRDHAIARPALVKVDVEGYELAVLEGAAGSLASTAGPAVVFETHGAHLERAGVRFADLPGWFESRFGYQLFALMPAGLQRIAPGTARPPANNSLALHPVRHRAALERLSRTRFRRNQSC